MSEPIRDPVHRARYLFHPEGDDMVVETWLEPGGGLPAHVHPGQQERWSVVEGEVRFQLGKDERLLRPADGEVLVEAGTMHALSAVAESDAHLRCHVSPALGLEAFLTDSAAAAREGLFMRGGIPKSLRGARWAAKFLDAHRADVVMAFPPQFMQRVMIGLFGR